MKEIVRPFGVELEFYLTGSNIPLEQAVSALQAVGLEAKRESYNHKRRKHWKAVQDTSVLSGDGNYGGEVASPILRGEPGIEEMRKAADALRDAGFETNNTCGTHVHFGFKGYGPGAAHASAETKRKEMVTLGHFLKNWMILERAADTYQIPTRRGNAAQNYARSLSLPQQNTYFSPEYVEQVWKKIDDMFLVSPDVGHLQTLWRDGLNFRSGLSSGGGRDGKLNPTPLWDSQHPHHTLEVRHLHGTLNSRKIENWIRFINDIWLVSAEGKVPDVLYVPQSELLDWTFSYLNTEPEVAEYMRQQATILGSLEPSDGTCASCHQDFAHCRCGRAPCQNCGDDDHHCGCCQVCLNYDGECECCPYCGENRNNGNCTCAHCENCGENLTEYGNECGYDHDFTTCTVCCTIEHEEE